MIGGLKQHQIDRICAVLSHHPEVEEAILYGSRVKNCFKNGSDVDLALKGGSLDLKILNKISVELDDLLLPYNIDLSLYDAVKEPELRNHIDRVGVIVYQKSAASLNA